MERITRTLVSDLPEHQLLTFVRIRHGGSEREIVAQRAPADFGPYPFVARFGAPGCESGA